MKITHEASIKAWEDLANWWDGAIGEGDIFHTYLIFPEVIKALDLYRNIKILDLACGNGALSRRLATLGATVVGVDVTEEFLQKAQTRTQQHNLLIEYLQCDLTDEVKLKHTLSKYKNYFDRIVCSMSLHDISDINPMIKSFDSFLKHNGTIVVSLPHPCFNSGYIKYCELDNIPDMGVFRNDYINNCQLLINAKLNQPYPHVNYHRSLSSLLKIFFEHGFKLTGLTEPTMKDKPNLDNFLWSKMPNIPPVMILKFIR